LQDELCGSVEEALGNVKSMVPVEEGKTRFRTVLFRGVEEFKSAMV
jgi:hypothetical protein